ncbi:class I SAM-dependent methyltransferase [Effusibacillus lacus]|uniref:S-adenosyl-L-methionine-dependent methyltransferase n=1 Tax=Effusibacillus lacus TaxID=1348429 RepID=A0A292YS03_9BACL|nr:class I SAM-dependent methyltransferase [Effusibacillus lacus]TCS74878.1 methyltransferase (TIGR00027 family) [Effusibacillus lacus]GAX91553.1 SAM-dependent methyltransferase [Effusibacillus lacus]
MEDSQVKRTALMSAYLRGYHAVHNVPKIFDDFLAYRLLTEEELAAFDQAMVTALAAIDPARAALFPDRADAVACMIQSFFPTSLFLSRARYTEDSLKMAVRQGVKQYVILGAGMDTFAFRCPEIVQHIEVFEVDHPTTQAFKRRRLTELGWEPPAHLHFVPVDFTSENLETALTRSSYDRKAPSFFSWLGVIHYLPRDAVFTTLRTIANICPAGSRVIFDYWDTDAFVAEKAAKRVKLMQDMVRRAGEPMLTGLNPSTLAEELQFVGLRLQEQLSPLEIQERYFQGRTDDYYAYEHAYFASAVVE